MQVYDSLESLEIQPQLYILKWARLIFCREMDVYDAMELWDFMFARKAMHQQVFLLKDKTVQAKSTTCANTKKQ